MFQSQQTQQADFTIGKLKARYTQEVKRGSLHRPDLPWPVCHGPPRHPAVSLRATHGWWSQVLGSSLFSPSLARLSKRCLEPGLPSSHPKPPFRFLSCEESPQACWLLSTAQAISNATVPSHCAPGGSTASQGFHKGLPSAPRDIFRCSHRGLGLLVAVVVWSCLQQKANRMG